MDIDSFAVNIAMLRMWLSLAIDYEGDTPEPLPNLDFKVVCGDSLLGPDPSSGAEVQGTLGQDVAQMQRLGDLKGEFMRAKPGPGKDRLRADIESVKVEIRESLGVVANDEVLNWRVEFAEVFGGGRGFDVAIANPPYVQLQKDGGRLGTQYRDGGYTTFVRTGDVYQLFYERGCQVLRPAQGILAYITSNSWLKAEYGKSTRRYFAEKHKPLLLLELGKDVFESAIVDSGVLMLRTGAAAGPFRAVDMDRVKSEEVPPLAGLWGQAWPSGDAPWSVMSLPEHSVLDKMRAKGTPLKEWEVRINRGVTTGYNDAFIIDDATRQRLIDADPSSEEIIKPVLRGRNIQRYHSLAVGLWLIYSHSKVGENDYPAIREHLLPHKQALSNRRGGANPKTGQVPYDWWQLQVDYYNSGTYKEFDKEKLIWMDLTEQGRFAYDDRATYCLDTTFLMTGQSAKYLCAVLNSTLVTWFMQNTALTSGMGVTRWKRFAVETIPVPKLSASKQRPFVRLVDRILEAKASDPGADTSELEREIDRLVYELYGLTEEETAAVGACDRMPPNSGAGAP